eukprot:426856-Amphidinium_carterae.4
MPGGHCPSAAQSAQPKGGTKGGKPGKAKPAWRGQAYIAELPSLEEDDPSTYPGEDIEFEPIQDETPQYEYDDDAVYDESDDTYLDLVDPEDPDSIEAYAVLNQAQAKLKNGKGRGRGGKSASSKGSTAASPLAVNNAQLPFKSTGPGRVQWQQNQDRKKKLALLKQKTQCSACGRYGHWAGDAECNATSEDRQSGAKKGGQGSAYFVITDSLDEDDPGQAFMMRKKKGPEMMEWPCEHAERSALCNPPRCLWTFTSCNLPEL